MNTIAITGATGFLGQLLIDFILQEYNPTSIRLLGRNEWKLAKIIRKYNDLYSFKQFRPMICDVRDRERVFSCLKDCDLIIHAAALKRLEIANYNPQEAIKTNVIGSMNVMDACLNVGVKKSVFVSSDKAVNATNLYGKTKSVMESMVIERAIMVGAGEPVMCVVRYGNVIGSTGAVIPYFIQLAKDNQPLPITNKDMTRYLITKKDAVEVIRQAINHGQQAEIIIPKELKAINIFEAAKAINNYFGNDAGMRVIGAFSGEKLHEEITRELNSDKTRQLTHQEFIALLKEDGLLD